MTIHISPRTIKLAKIFISLIFLFTIVGIVPSAQAGGSISGTPYAILAETMSPANSDIKYDKVSGYLVTTSTVGSPGYIGQVNLPNGATIVGVAAYGIDMDTAVGKEFSYCLYRYSLEVTPAWGAKPVTPCVLSNPVSGSGNKIYLYSPADALLATVDNANYSYGVYLNLPPASVTTNPPTLAVLRFVVYWNYPVYLPSVTK